MHFTYKLCIINDMKHEKKNLLEKFKKKSSDQKTINISLTERTDFLLTEMALQDFDENIDFRPSKSGFIKKLIMREAKERGIVE